LLAEGDIPLQQCGTPGGKCHFEDDVVRDPYVRACLSIFIYGKTNKQFRACGNIVYGETGKIREFALSRYPRQDNYNVNKTKSYYLISSKLTPVDAS
jgi:hypothetical protein